MKSLIKLTPQTLYLAIIVSALATFILGIWVVFSFQAQTISSKKIENVINNAEKMMNFDSNIPFERALQTYSIDQTYAVFDNACKTKFITDLKVTESACKNQDSNFIWFEIASSYIRPKLIIGYSMEYSFSNFVNDYLSILLSTAIAYLTFVSFSTYLFFHFFLFQPIKQINKEIEFILKEGIPRSGLIFRSSSILLSKLDAAFSSIVSELVRLNTEEEKAKISKQIVHDLRAPLSALEQTNYETNPTISSLALKRIREISNDLLAKQKSSIKSEINIVDLINEFQILFPQLKINHTTQNNLSSIHLLQGISESELFRFISNIIKNSIEAKSTTVEIFTKSADNLLHITFSDNGNGIEPEKLSEVLNGKSFKVDGNGLGISAIRKKLIEIKGSIKIESNPHKGFKLQLAIPITNPEYFILVDDDRIIRANWAIESTKYNVPFKAFSTLEDFISDSEDIPKNSFIYIDSNLGNDVKGEWESKIINDLGYSNIFLATGYAPSDFKMENHPWLLGVVSKSPPFNSFYAMP